MITSRLTSQGSQDTLNSTGGKIAQIGTSLYGGMNGTGGMPAAQQPPAPVTEAASIPGAGTPAGAAPSVGGSLLDTGKAMASNAWDTLSGLPGASTVGSSLLTSAAMGAITPKPQMPQAPNIPTPPQAAKVPNAIDVNANMMGHGGAGGTPGIAQTLLTGGQGVDPATLLLGKKTLLGA